MILTGILILIAIPLGTWLITGDTTTTITVGLWTLLLQPLMWFVIAFVWPKDEFEPPFEPY